MFRWKGIIFLAVLIGLFIVLGLVFTDQWLEQQLEKTASYMVGARVEFDDLDFSLSKVRLKWQRLQVTDPKHTMTNLFETGESDLDLEFWPLLSKKVIVEDFRIHNFRTSTARKEDGRLSEKEKHEKPNFVIRALSALGGRVQQQSLSSLSTVKKNLNVDSLLKHLNLQSPQKIDSLQRALSADYQSWKTRFASLRIKEDIAQTRASLKGIDLKKIKKLDQLLAALKKIDAAKKKIKDTRQKYMTLKTDFEVQLKRSKEGLRLADDWIKNDYKRARSMAKLPDISLTNIGKFVFGPTLVNKVQTYLGYITTVRHYASKLKSDKPPKAKPPRLKGQDIYFYNPNARPDWWIKKIDLSGQTSDGLALSGLIQNLVSDQRQIHKVTKIHISGENNRKTRLELAGTLNYLGVSPRENFRLDYRHFPLKGKNLIRSSVLSTTAKNGFGKIAARADLQGDTTQLTIQFDAAGLNLLTEIKGRKTTEIQRILGQTIDGMHRLDLSAFLTILKGRSSLKVKSNLDRQLAARLKSVVGERVNKAAQKIRKEMDARLQPQREKLARLISTNEKQLKDQIASYQQMLKEQQSAADRKKKEIETRIAREKNKLGKQLKGLFK